MNEKTIISNTSSNKKSRATFPHHHAHSEKNLSCLGVNKARPERALWVVLQNFDRRFNFREGASNGPLVQHSEKGNASSVLLRSRRGGVWVSQHIYTCCALQHEPERDEEFLISRARFAFVFACYVGPGGSGLFRD